MKTDWADIFGTLMGVLLFAGIFALAGWAGVQSSREQQAKAKTKTPDVQYRVVEIEGCEYIQSKVASGYFTLTHKGNCKNHQ